MTEQLKSREGSMKSRSADLQLVREVETEELNRQIKDLHERREALSLRLSGIETLMDAMIEGGMLGVILLALGGGELIGLASKFLLGFTHPLALAIALAIGTSVVLFGSILVSKRVIADTIHSLDEQIYQKEIRIQEIGR